MKRTFLARRNALLAPGGVSWGGAALATALLVLLLRLLAPGAFERLAVPAFAAADALSAASRSIAAGWSDRAALASANAALAEENRALAEENQALLQKAADLSALLGTGAPPPPGITAGVLARPPESPYDTLVLAAGSRAGVVRGMEAFGPGGIPLGVVGDVLPGLSRVTLFSAPGIETQGWLGKAPRTPVTLFGAGGGALRATLPRAAGAAVGDLVFAPGPGALPVGAVARVDSEPSSPSVTLRIAPAANLFSLSWVLLRDAGGALLTAATSTSL